MSIIRKFDIRKNNNVSRVYTMCFVVLPILIVSLCTAIFYDTVDAQVDSNTLESIAEQTEVSERRAQIDVGDGPNYIYGAHSKLSDVIYVANSDSNTVSVIDTTTNIVTENILVGRAPSHIYGDLLDPGVIYVANLDSDTISVVDTYTYSVIDIPVGTGPFDIYAIAIQVYYT